MSESILDCLSPIRRRMEWLSGGEPRCVHSGGEEFQECFVS